MAKRASQVWLRWRFWSREISMDYPGELNVITRVQVLVGLSLHSASVQNSFFLSPQTGLFPQGSQVANSSVPWCTHSFQLTPCHWDLIPALDLTTCAFTPPRATEGLVACFRPLLCPSTFILLLALKTIHPLSSSMHLFQNKVFFLPILIRLQASQRQQWRLLVLWQSSDSVWRIRLPLHPQSGAHAY